MPISPLRLFVPTLPINGSANTHFSPLLYYMMYCTQFQTSSKQSSCRVSLVKKKSPSLGVLASRGLHVVDTEETRDFGECWQQVDSSKEEPCTNETQLYTCYNSSESFIDENHKESQRRRKIGLANKGKVPWNKGRKHSAETRERIRQRTKEALMDPKIRKKMSESPRAHSDQTKAKIRSSHIKLWRERLKWKKSREKFLSSWAESIAEAAKKGGSDQKELHWDSYEKIKEEISLQQCQRGADQEKAKETAKIRAAQKAEKMARLAQNSKVQELKAEIRSESNRKSKEGREELAIARGLKLKERLTKIHKRKTSTNGQITCEDQRAWEKLDFDSIKMEHTRREVSLADQIRAAKTKRVECVNRESLPTAYSHYSARDQQNERLS